MRLIYTLLLAFFVTNAFAQVRQNVYFLKNNGKEVSTRDSADYIRIIREPDSGSVHYMIAEYYANGIPKLRGHTSTIKSVKLEGQCRSFFKDGKQSTVLNYTNGQLSGQQYYYYPNGILKEERNYPEKPADKTALIEGQYTINNYSDSTGNALIKDGSGIYKNSKTTKVKNKTSHWSTEGQVKNGFKNGTWNTSIDKDSIKLVETFDGGKFTSGTATWANGETYTYTEPDKLPEFKGGVGAFGKYLSSTLRYPVAAARQQIQGRVMVSFNVDVDGSVIDIKTTGKVPSDDLADEAMRVIGRSPKWVPGRQYGRVAKTLYTVPIVFTLAGI